MSDQDDIETLLGKVVKAADPTVRPLGSIAMYTGHMILGQNAMFLTGAEGRRELMSKLSQLFINNGLMGNVTNTKNPDGDGFVFDTPSKETLHIGWYFKGDNAIRTKLQTVVDGLENGSITMPEATKHREPVDELDMFTYEHASLKEPLSPNAPLEGKPKDRTIV